MPKPLVSILIAAYNHERFIEEAVRSLINQTYQNLELIIIDDGSQDETYQKILKLEPECEKRFVRVDFSSQKNIGVGLTLNRLIEKTAGEFIFIMASDDVAKPNVIETLVNFMVAHDDYVLAVGDNEFIDINSKRIGWDKYSHSANIKKARYKTFGSYYRHARKDFDFLSKNFGTYETLVQGNYIPNGYLTRASAQKQRKQHTSEAPLEDWYMHLQLSKLGKYKYIDEVLFSYRIHGDNTFSKTEKMREMTLKTRLYEQKSVHQKGMEHLAEIFDKYSVIKKTKFRIGKFVHFYKQIDLTHKTNILEVLGRQFVLKRKER